MAFAIRAYEPADLGALYDICLRTGAGGEDATALYSDPELLGHFYAAPYAVREPDLCFVLAEDGAPVGYILGTRDSVAFREWCEREWFPPLRERYPLPDSDDRSPDAHIIRLIHVPYPVDPAMERYPAHLHIDILPVGQGQGRGAALMERFLGRLRELGVAGVHLGVGARNIRAVRFYERVGFERLKSFPEAIVFGMELAQPPTNQTSDI